LRVDDPPDQRRFRCAPRRIGRTKDGPNSTLHAVCDKHGQPRVMLLSEGQMSDDKGAALMIDAMPDATGAMDPVAARRARGRWMGRSTNPGRFSAASGDQMQQTCKRAIPARR
jgi:transposase